MTLYKRIFLDSSLKYLDISNSLTLATIEQARDGIFWLDKDGQIYMANSAACEFLGYTKEELLKMNISQIDIDYPPKIYKELWYKVGKEKKYKFEARHRRKNGEIYPVEIVAYYIEFEGKALQCGFFRDITEKKETEANLRKALDEVTTFKKKLEIENKFLKKEIKLNSDFGEIIGQSKALKEVLKKVEQVAETDVNVMILGETGTGKELIARALHNLGNRKNGAFVPVNCASLPSGLIESELFGYEKGAFTGANSCKVGRFELADKGTLFLDEITEIPVEVQSKLLRVLQENEFERLGGLKLIKVDTHLITATNKDPFELVEQGFFREDLYYRLNVFPIVVPPLRERKEDIPLLVKFFIEKISLKLGKKIDHVPEKTITQLTNYSWPGNIRELRNIIERAIILSNNNKLVVDECFASLAKKKNSVTNIFEKEKQHIITILEQTNWKVSGKSGAAELLGLKPTTLEARMKKLSINRPEKI